MKKKASYIILVAGLCCIFPVYFFVVNEPIIAQSPIKNSGNSLDSLEILNLIRNSRILRTKMDFNGARTSATNALNLAKKINWQDGNSLAYLEIGNSLESLNRESEAFDNYLHSSANWTTENWKSERMELNRKLGAYYQKIGYYEKAVKEFENANKYVSDKKEKSANDEMLAYSLVQLGKFENAIALYQDLTNTKDVSNSSDTDRSIRALDALVDIYIRMNKYDKALIFAEQLVAKMNGNPKYSAQNVLNLNRIGFLNLKLGNQNQALTYYLKSLEDSKKLENGSNANIQALLNLGYLQTLSQDYLAAISSFETAEKIAVSNKNKNFQAQSLNHLAATYLISNSQLETAIELGLEAEKLLIDDPNGKNDLSDTYLVLTELYRKTGDFENAQNYERLRLELQTQKQKNIEKSKQNMAQARLEIEQKESELKLLVADEEKRRLEENRSKLEIEKHESELQLKKRELEILKERQARQEADIARQNLERQRIQQQLLLAEQKIVDDKKNREILELQKNQEIQKLAIDQKNLKEKEQGRELKLLEANQKIQDQKQHDIDQRQRYFWYGLGGLSIFSFLIGYSFLQKRKDNRLLNKQKKEIEKNFTDLELANKQIQESNEELEANQEELRQNSEELQATNDYLKSVTEQLTQLSLVASKTDNSVIITDANGLLEWVNDGFTKITGYRLDEVVGKKPGSFLQGKDTDPETVERIRKKLMLRSSVSEEILNYSKSGKSYWLQLNITPIFDELGILTNFIAVESDITERVEREKEISKANIRIQEAMNQLQETQNSLVQSEKLASLGQMVAGISHEINTPIGVAYTAVTFTKEATDQFIAYLSSGEKIRKSDIEAYASNTQESNSIIYDNLKRAADLVASFKKVSVEQTKDERNTFNLKEFLRDILVSLTPEVRKNKLSTKIICPDNILIDSYPSDFSQVCINLVMNSIKHGFDGFTEESRQKEIIFECELIENDNVIIRYTDNGKGIPSEILPKIFDPFFTTKRNTGGSGLGLNIVYNTVVQKMKGNITCESIVNQKTIFTIKLPMIIS